MTNSEVKQEWPSRLMLWLSVFIIIFWIITICSPSLFWNIVDIILWFFLLTGWISAIINALKNKDSDLVWLLWIGGFLLTLIWFWLMFSRTHLVWTIMIWVFALWALIRWVMLIIFWINNKDQQPFWWWIVWLWWLLFVLAIIIICVPKSESRSLAWICIWISTVLDGISLLVFALKVKDNPSLQSELINQADQNEIAQWDIVITQTVITSNNNSNNQDNTQSSSDTID